VTRTCFGRTKNYNRRQIGYKGHAGHRVKFTNIWLGPRGLIIELENKLKQEFYEYLLCGVYEWICEPIKLEQIAAWIDWEIAEITTVTRVV
jgi:hypothetical protein